ncbi:MAG: hypothetical protein M0024_12210 [Nitrospiraceae bacterium]|nr:hypothetical protein [Nitrospiraceae bacterium]
MSNFRLAMAAGVLLLGLSATNCARQVVRQETIPPVVCPEVPAPAPEKEEPRAVETEPVPPVTVEPSALAFVVRYYSDIAPPDIPGEIASLLPVVRKTEKGGGTAMAHLKLAWLYGYYKNPSPLYARALQELDAYLVSQTAEADAVILRNWRRLLKELVTAHRENLELKERLGTLSSQMEQLKHLDIEMEKTRKMMQ